MNTLNTQKGFVVPLLIAIVAILVAGGVYVAVKHHETAPANAGTVATTTSSTADNSVVNSNSSWKTYTNSQYGFTFNYPSQWGTSKTLLNGEVSIGDSLVVANRATVAISPQIGTPITITVDGKQGIEEWSDQVGTIVRLPLSDGSALELNTGYKPDDATLKQILSTLKFISAQSVVTNSELKTYTNSQYGFSVQYPQVMNYDVDASGKSSTGSVSFSSANSVSSNGQLVIDVPVALNSSNPGACTTLTNQSEYVDVGNVSINGVSFVTYTEPTFMIGSMSAMNKTYKVAHNGNCYSLREEIRNMPGSNSGQVSTELDAVVQTFKFTN